MGNNGRNPDGTFVLGHEKIPGAGRPRNTLKDYARKWLQGLSDDEKKAFPAHETTGGYLKRIQIKEARTNMWGNLTEENKALFPKLPNFDKAKFKEITGIEIA